MYGSGWVGGVLRIGIPILVVKYHNHLPQHGLGFCNPPQITMKSPSHEKIFKTAASVGSLKVFKMRNIILLLICHVHLSIA